MYITRLERDVITCEQYRWQSGRCIKDYSRRARMNYSELRPFSLTFSMIGRLTIISDDSQCLENLCDYLYDSLRPRILHEPKLEVLCELCTVLSAMMALDSDGRVADDDDDEDIGDSRADQSMTTTATKLDANALPPIPPLPSPRPLGRMRFSILLQTILQDSQTRLVFRAQAVIQTDVSYFTPSADDLAYPEKLESCRNESLSLWNDEERAMEKEIGAGFRTPRKEVQGSWYPTLKRTVWVLSQLNSFVDVSTLLLA